MKSQSDSQSEPQSDSQSTSGELPNAGILRRTAAFVYDLFLIVAIWILSTIVVIAIFTDGEEITGLPFQLFLLAEVFLFYAYFWRMIGQTLGMQVWKIRAENEAGELLNWSESFLRFGFMVITVAPFGLGFLWMLFEPKKLTLYDRLSKTRLVFTGTESKKADASEPVKSEEQSAKKSKRKKKKK